MLVRFAQWGTLIIIYIRRLGFNFTISIFLWSLRKEIFFWGYEDFVDILWAHHKTFFLFLFFFFGGGGVGWGARFNSFDVF